MWKSFALVLWESVNVWVFDKLPFALIIQVITAIGNFCICSVAIGLVIEIIVIYGIHHRGHLNFYANSSFCYKLTVGKSQEYDKGGISNPYIIIISLTDMTINYVSRLFMGNCLGHQCWWLSCCTLMAMLHICNSLV